MKLKDILGMSIAAILMAIIVVSYKPKVSYKLADTKKDIISIEKSEDIVNEEELMVDMLH